MSKQANKTAWIKFGNWEGPVLELPNASWRINTFPRGGSIYTHSVSAQASYAEITRAIERQFGIRELDCIEDTTDHNPLMTTVNFRNTKRDGIGGPDYRLKRIDQVAV